MRLGGLLLLVVLLASLVVVVRSRGRSRSAGQPLAPEEQGAEQPAGPPGPLADDLARWVAAGLLSEEQAAKILAHEAANAPEAGIRPTPSPALRLRGAPVVSEALGYLGGVLASAGLVLLVARYWADIATPGRLALSGGGALGLLGAGALVREKAAPALARLRWFLWLASTAMTAVLMWVLTVDGFGAHGTTTVVLACAGAVTLESGALWWRLDRPIQQLTFLGGVATSAGAGVGEVATGGFVGITVWVVGGAFLALGLRRLLPLPTLTEAVGALSLVAGSVVVANHWQGFGFVLGVATALGLLALATVPGPAAVKADQLTLGILGVLGLLEAAPSVLVHFSHDAGAATGLVTWGAGAVLVLVGSRRLVRVPLVAELLGCAAIVGGAAITGTQWHGFAPLFGVATGVLLVGLGMLPGQMLLSVAGSLALLVNVPWAIVYFFPGEGRAPLLIFVSGALILAIAVLLSLRGGWFHRDAAARRDQGPPPGPEGAKDSHGPAHPSSKRARRAG